MNLILDIGNTTVKLAVFNDEQLIEKRVFNIKQLLEQLRLILNIFSPIRKSIISSVTKLDLAVVNFIKSKIGSLLILSSETNVPFTNHYKTPKTLGVDRIALVSAAAKKYPNKAALIIDAGTCVTYDFINKEQNYLGGAISPGLTLRYKSLHQLTANLPLLLPTNPSSITGNTTESAIHSGVVNGLVTEIQGAINEYQKKHKDLTIILTGGDMDFLSKRLKNTIFANSIFLLEGLNYILEYNSTQ